MSVKRILIASSAVILVLGLGVAGTRDAVKTRDKIEFQEKTLETKESEIETLNVKYDKLNKNLDKASEDKTKNQEEIDRLQQEKEVLNQEKTDLEAQLQAKKEHQKKLAQASSGLVDKITGTQTVSASSYGADTIKDMIRNAAAKHGLSAERMLRVADCESTFNPNAVNRNYTAGGGNPSGLYQYLPETWNRIGGRSPYGAGNGPSSRFDVQHNINVTMWAWASGYSGEWACQ